MRFEQIISLYPNAKITNVILGSDYVAFYFNNKWINIPKIEITEKEIKLLKVLLNSNKEKTSKSKWYSFLIKQGPAPQFKEAVRFLFFKNSSKNFSRENWLLALKNMFASPILDAFSLDQDCYCFIEQKHPSNYTKTDFTGVINTVDADINSNTKLFIGNFWQPADLENLPTLFDEEYNIFRNEINNETSAAFSLSDVALHYYSTPKCQNSLLIRHLKRQIRKDDQLKSIIITLFQTQGNISLAAKKLYIHRNTLQYHLDKILRLINLDLRKPNDLLLAYLATF